MEPRSTSRCPPDGVLDSVNEVAISLRNRLPPEIEPHAAAGFIIYELAIRVMDESHPGLDSAHHREGFAELVSDLADCSVAQAAKQPPTQWSNDALIELGSEFDAIDASGDADLLGRLYESLLDSVATSSRAGSGSPSRRKLLGTYYTPEPLITHLVEQTLRASRSQPTQWRPRICDPSAGSGRFLIEAARQLVAHERKSDPDFGESDAVIDIVSNCVYAVDIDPVAIAITRFRLWQLAGFDECVVPMLRSHCRVGDALQGAPVADHGSKTDADRWCDEIISKFPADEPHDAAKDWFHWQFEFPEIFASDAQNGFDAVVGNPPFLSQLSAGTAFSRRTSAIVRAWSGGALKGHADAATAFLWRSISIVRPGGRATLVQPLSLLAARDADGIRRMTARCAPLEAIWLGTEPVFGDADVMTCAPTFRVGPPSANDVSRWHAVPPVRTPGLRRDELDHHETWSSILADLHGVPSIEFKSSSTIGDHAEATADFRDQYYGLEGFLIDRESADDNDFPPLITTGLIDPASCRWAQAGTRIHKARWNAPRIDRRRMEHEGTLGAWITSRLIPKVLIATQTRVIEAVADEHGSWVPSTPVLTLVPARTIDLWRLAAALSSPVCSAWAFRRYAGAALTSETLKLAARQILTLPLPKDGPAWDRAAEAFQRAQHASTPDDRRGALHASAHESLDAYGVASADRDPLMVWWSDRLPSR